MRDRFVSGLHLLGLELPDEKIDLQLEFLAELLRWNQRINLTAIRDPGEAMEKHLLDSLAMLKYIQKQGRLLDMGSGGGFPGIPLVLTCPDLQLVSVDAVGKKINFQKHIKRKFALENFNPIHCRLEALGQQVTDARLFDQITARAFASFSAMVKLAAPWLKQGGELLAMKGPEGRQELAESSEPLGLYGFELVKISSYILPISGAERQIMVLRKK